MAEEQEKELPYIEFVKQLYVEQGFYHITPLHDGRMAGSPRCEHYFGIYNPDNKGHREIKIDTNGGELDKIAELDLILKKDNEDSLVDILYSNAVSDQMNSYINDVLAK